MNEHDLTVRFNALQDNLTRVTDIAEGLRNAALNREAELLLSELSVETLKARVQNLETVVRRVLKSASPNQRDNPSMYAAWQAALEVL